MIQRNKKGTFEKLSGEKQNELFSAFVNVKYNTLSEIASGLKISKATVINYRDNWVNTGQLSENNWFVKKPQNLQPSVLQRLIKRRQKMRLFILRRARSGKKVSANELQNRFGGEKKIAGQVLEEVSVALAKRRKSPLVIRRTVSDQPLRARKLKSPLRA